MARVTANSRRKLRYIQRDYKAFHDNPWVFGPLHIKTRSVKLVHFISSRKVSVEYTFDQEQKTWQVSGNLFFELKFHDQWCYYPCLLVIVHLITQGWRSCKQFLILFRATIVYFRIRSLWMFQFCSCDDVVPILCATCFWHC